MALLSAISFYGQRRVAAKVNELLKAKTTFTPYAPFTVSNVNKGNSAKAVTNATYAILNTMQLQHIARQKPEAIEITVPYNGSALVVQLYRVEVAAQGFHTDTDKQQAIPYNQGAFYRGIIKGDNTSLASFNFFDKEVSGIISNTQLGNLVVGRLNTAGNFSDYIIYSDANLNLKADMSCGVVDTAKLAPQKSGAKTFGVLSQNCVTVYFEIDYDLYAANNFNTDLTNNWVFSVFNNTQTIFDNDGITVAIKSIFVWTEPDVYTGESSADYLLQFRTVRPYFDGDVGQLLGLDPIGKGGVAIGIAGLCSDSNVSYGNVFYEYEEVPVYSNTVEVITHELGHLFGSPHTHGCYWNGDDTAIDGCGTMAGYVEGDCETGPIPYEEKGTIMSYCHLIDGAGTSFANGFGPQPTARILNHIASSSCLSSDCINTCINAITAFDVSQSTQTEITVSWTDAGTATSWEVGYATISGAINNWQVVTAPTFTFTGLQPNTYYKFGVRPVCLSGQTAGSQQIVVATADNWCSGVNFTDTAGNNNYPNSQHLIRTIKPDNASQSLVVTFNSFSTEEDFDFLYVYDGPNTNSPLIGTYDGTEIPGPFSSTPPDGALTFEFRSDDYLNAPGWNATVSCLLAAPVNTFAQLSYYPNPTNGTVVIASPEGITNITVYNVAGQLLLDSTSGSTTETTADISAFADGVYFFKVTNGTKQSNFRIIKQQ